MLFRSYLLLSVCDIIIYENNIIWGICMSEVFTTTLISVGATVLTNLIIHGFAYLQKKIESKNKLEEKKVDFLNAQLSQDRDLYISTFQDFASISGKTVSFVDSRSDDADPIDLDIITNFDDIFYKAYLFLDNDDERETFITFRNVLRYLAGYKHREGFFTWDIEMEEEFFDPNVIEEPRYIFERLNDCLLIVNSHITNKLHL